eukprot:7054985-Prymnesium_polylepis.1
MTASDETFVLSAKLAGRPEFNFWLGPRGGWPMAYDGRWPMMSPGAVSGRYARPMMADGR